MNNVEIQATTASKDTLVSICCLAHNHENYINQCLDGFLRQKTNFSFEILIHDDASTDSTAMIINDYAEKHPDIIKPIYQTENQYSRGVKPSWKFNFPRATGKYIAMCEGDDYWTDPHKLQKQVDFLENNIDYVLCHHDATIVDFQGNQIKESKLPLSCRKDFSSLELKKGAFLLTLTLCFRNVFNSFPAEAMEVANGDTFLISLLGNYGKAKFMMDIQPAVYRVHQGGVWSGINQEKKLKMRLSLFSTLKNYYNGERELRNYFEERERGVMRQLIYLSSKSNNSLHLKELSRKYLKISKGFSSVYAYFFLIKIYLYQTFLKLRGKDFQTN